MIGCSTFAAAPLSVSVMGFSTAEWIVFSRSLPNFAGLVNRTSISFSACFCKPSNLRLQLLLALLLHLRLLFLELILCLSERSEQILLRLRRHYGSLRRVLFFRNPRGFDLG